MSGNKKTIYLGLLIILVIAAGLIIKSGKKRPAGTLAKETTPSYGNIRNFISTTGVVQPQNRLEIKPPISGRIEQILVREGQKVKAGEILAWMSSTERAALLDTARSQSQEVVDYWSQAYKPTPLIAPLEGEVIVRAVEPGQTVTSSDAVIVLSDRLIVKAQVDETDIGKVKTDQSAIISLDAYPQVIVEATIEHISYESRVVNNVTIYEVDVLPEEVPGVFRSGMSASVDIIEAGKENVLIIPLDAVKRDEKGNFVMLSQGKGRKPVERRVALGISDENNVEVIAGLGPEDKIIINSQTYNPQKEPSSKGSPLTPFGGRRR